LRSRLVSHLRSAVAPGRIEYVRYDWRRAELWNLAFVAGVLIGVFLTLHIGGPQVIAISQQTRRMHGIIGSAVITAALSLALLKPLKFKSISGEAVYVPPKTLGSGIRYAAGGTMFGLGWALTGACPGPLVALVGNRVTVMFAGLLSALLGTWVYGWIRPKLPH
jgi:hypothetical protein